MSEGYFEITLIPSGSRHIMIEEMGPSKNFIGVGKSDSKDFYLNGDRLISMSGEYDVAGAVGLYERENEVEKLKIPGPIKEDISLYVSLLKRLTWIDDKILSSLRSFSKESTRISESSTSTPCHRTQLITPHIIGNCQISRSAQRLAEVDCSKGFPSATSVTKAPSKKNCAGRMLKIKGRKRFQGPATMSLVLLIGGLARGSLVQ